MYKAWKHFKKIFVHKYWVFRYCCKAGIPVQGLLHDLSKFSPVEFFESVKFCGQVYDVKKYLEDK